MRIVSPYNTKFITLSHLDYQLYHSSWILKLSVCNLKLEQCNLRTWSTNHLPFVCTVKLFKMLKTIYEVRGVGVKKILVKQQRELGAHCWSLHHLFHIHRKWILLTDMQNMFQSATMNIVCLFMFRRVWFYLHLISDCVYYS